MEKSDKKNNPKEESKDVIKRHELEQTHKLLVTLSNDLFDKVEKMNTKKEDSKQE